MKDIISTWRSVDYFNLKSFIPTHMRNWDNEDWEEINAEGIDFNVDEFLENVVSFSQHRKDGIIIIQFNDGDVTEYKGTLEEC